MKLLKGYLVIADISNQNHFHLYKKIKGKNPVFIGISAESNSEAEAIKIFNDHIPLLPEDTLEEQVFIKFRK